MPHAKMLSGGNLISWNYNTPKHSYPIFNTDGPQGLQDFP